VKYQNITEKTVSLFYARFLVSSFFMKYTALGKTMSKSVFLYFPVLSSVYVLVIFEFPKSCLAKSVTNIHLLYSSATFRLQLYTGMA